MKKGKFKNQQIFACYISVLLMLNFISLNAQLLTQTILGQVIDKQSEQSLPGATVSIPGTSPLMATSTNVNGNFKFSNIPIGRVTIQISYVGYETVTLGNIYLNSGKELVLHVELEEKAQNVRELP